MPIHVAWRPSYWHRAHGPWRGLRSCCWLLAVEGGVNDLKVLIPGTTLAGVWIMDRGLVFAAALAVRGRIENSVRA